VDLSFQDVTKELADLPGKYLPPHGSIFLAWDKGTAVGCVALRAFSGITHSCSLSLFASRKKEREKGEREGRGKEREREGRREREVHVKIGTSKNNCEMKRLYVRPQARGKEIGRKLAEKIIAYAKSTNLYSRMVLDSLISMHAAKKLYTSLGFYEIPPYYSNPLPGATYFALEL
jgi:putative acetyltransferase